MLSFKYLPCVGTSVTLSEEPNLLENYCSASISFDSSPRSLRSLSGTAASSSFFFQRENTDGLLGLREFSLQNQTQHTLTHPESRMDLRFHDSLCKKKTKKRAALEGERWSLLLPSAPCSLSFSFFSIPLLLRRSLKCSVRVRIHRSLRKIAAGFPGLRWWFWKAAITGNYPIKAESISPSAFTAW